MDYFLRFDRLGLMVVYKNFDRFDRSNVFVENGFVKVYNKRERFSEMVYIDFGVSVLRKEALGLIPSGKFVNLEEFYQDLIKRGSCSLTT